MKQLFAIVYVLILITQFPHVWAAYAAHEQEGIGHLTAAGAALGFELSTALFTYRIVTGSTRKWTRWGVRFFIAMSVVANLQYYGAFGGMVIAITPYVFAVALPVALVLYAEEFGVEIRKEERKAAQATQAAPQTTQAAPQPARSEPQPVEVKLHDCAICGAGFSTQQGLAAHIRHRHRPAAKPAPSANGHESQGVEV